LGVRKAKAGPTIASGRESTVEESLKLYKDVDEHGDSRSQKPMLANKVLDISLAEEV